MVKKKATKKSAAKKTLEETLEDLYGELRPEEDRAAETAFEKIEDLCRQGRGERVEVQAKRLWAEAEKQAHGFLRDFAGPAHMRALTLNMLADIYRRTARLEEALEAMARSLRLWRELDNVDPADLQFAGDLALQLERPEEAAMHFAEAEGMLRKVEPPSLRQ